MAVPGLTPRSPVMRVGPVRVTVDPARTTNAAAAPSTKGACPHAPVLKLQTLLAAKARPPESPRERHEKEVNLIGVEASDEAAGER